MSRHTSVKILIADDFPIVRHGLRLILAEELGAVVFGEAANSRELIELVRREHWDVVVLDICMPGRSGLDAVKELKATRPAMPILVFSMYPEDQFAERAIMCGADGYLNKESAPDELVTALKKVLAGGRYVSSSWAEDLVRKLKGGLNKAPHESLSRREYEIMLLTASGKTTAEMAAELSLSVKTVSTYRTRTLHKMCMRSTAELIRYTIQEHLTS